MSIDGVQKMEIIQMEDIALFVCIIFVKVNSLPYMMKEVYDDHCVNKGCNMILIFEEYVMYLHHYGEMYSI